MKFHNSVSISNILMINIMFLIILSVIHLTVHEFYSWTHTICLFCTLILETRLKDHTTNMWMNLLCFPWSQFLYHQCILGDSTLHNHDTETQNSEKANDKHNGAWLPVFLSPFCIAQSAFNETMCSNPGTRIKTKSFENVHTTYHRKCADIV